MQAHIVQAQRLSPIEMEVLELRSPSGEIDAANVNQSNDHLQASLEVMSIRPIAGLPHPSHQGIVEVERFWPDTPML